MLKTANLYAKLSRKDYGEQYEVLSPKLGELQRLVVEKNIPVLILTEGWHASEKGPILNQFLLSIDPRHYRYLSFSGLQKRYGKRLALVPFWQEIPSFGKIGILETDWYRYVYDHHYGNQKDDEIDLRAFYRDVNAFERELVQSGMIILKFFFHIDQKTQKKRLEERAANKAISWTADERTWRENKEYDDFFHAATELIQNTNTPFSSWHIIPANDFYFACSKTLRIIANALELYLNNPTSFQRPVPYHETDILASTVFANIDYAETIKEGAYKEHLKKLQTKLRNQIGSAVYKNIPVMVVFEGVDAAGKGGAIRRITQALFPLNYNVVPVSAPTKSENQRHFMWRFWRDFPTTGHLTIFDRSWYGRVLVERVENFTPEDEWQKAYDEINDTELHLTTWGVVIVKFYVQISKDEQLMRFESRKNTPDKQWKLTDEDWRNREKWDQYEEAASEMFARTSTTYAPWTLIAVDDKQTARIKILETLTNAIEERLDAEKEKQKSKKKD